MEAMSIIASETFTSVSAPIQFAAIEAYKEHELIDNYVNNTRKILKVVAEYVYSELLRLELTMPKPIGGFYVFPNFARWRKELSAMDIYSSIDLCNVLLNETGVALLPGEAFGLTSHSLTARLSYVDFDGEALLKQLEQDHYIELNHQFVANNCPKIVGAVEKIRSWILSIQK